MAKYKIELVRSDAGDGGWSLHAIREDLFENLLCDSQDAYPLLVSEPSRAGRDGEWLRPNRSDYSVAQKSARLLAARYPGRLRLCR